MSRATCVFCGQRFAGPALAAQAAIIAHVKACAQHPMRVVEIERNRWKARARALGWTPERGEPPP